MVGDTLEQVKIPFILKKSVIPHKLFKFTEHDPEKKEEFEGIMENNVYAQIGIVTKAKKLRIKGLNGAYIIDTDLDRLKKAWKSTLGAL